MSGTLKLAGAADPEARGIVLALTPAQAAAGQGTPARFVVRLTNVGSVADSFALRVVDLPPGITAMFEQATVQVPPGASNFRDVTFLLTPAAGTTANSYPFRVMAASATKATITGEAAGTLAVLASGVAVTLDPPSGPPGTPLSLTVTNTGQAVDTFNLTLGGSAALVASLGVNQVTLEPGASRVVTITTGAVSFAVPGAMPLVAVATSRANPAILDSASANLAIAAGRGLAARLDPAVRVLAVPGTTSYLLMVQNTGNVEDAYEAVLMGTTGPVTASLRGLDGQATRTIPVFRLPGLSTGAILIDADLAALGRGTVTVQVRSLSDGRTASVTATVSAGTLATTTVLLASPNPAPLGQAVTLTAIVAARTSGVPVGAVTFTVDGTPRPPVFLQVVGGQSRATLEVTGLSAGGHTVVVSYDGDATFEERVILIFEPQWLSTE